MARLAYMWFRFRSVTHKRLWLPVALLLCPSRQNKNWQ
jgi:hypothetical protein